MGAWSVEYYQDENGKFPVDKYISHLPPLEKQSEKLPKSEIERALQRMKRDMTMKKEEKGGEHG
jgi:phage-related protein